jgi:hypothetical protein
MELDDLKRPWQLSARNLEPLNKDIMQMIQKSSDGPVARLKRSFRKPLVLLPVVVLMLINNLAPRHAIFSDTLFWLYIGVCLVLIGYFYYSYRMVSRMQEMDGMVKANFEKQLNSLEVGIRRKLLFIRVMSIVFIMAVEILMYLQQEPSFARWYAQPAWLRLLCYSLLLTLFFFFTREVSRRKYSRHIQHLKELLSQMQ